MLSLRTKNFAELQLMHLLVLLITLFYLPYVSASLEIYTSSFEKDKMTEKYKSSVCWFGFQMCATAGAKPRSQDFHRSVPHGAGTKY